MKNFKVLCFIILVMLSFLVALNVNIGFVDLSFSDFFLKDSSNYDVAQFRINRVLVMLLVGVSVPTSGFLLQEYFQNPLAGPSVLGVTSIAGLFVAIYLFFLEGIMLPEWLQSSFMGSVAIGGSILFLLFLLLISKHFFDKTYLVIFGFLISSLAGAVISIFQYYAEGQKLKEYILWSFGSNNYINRERIFILFIFVLIGLLLSFKAIKPLIGNSLGDQYAKTMGVNLNRLKMLIIISSSLLSASVTAFVGPILFVGIVVPHFCRLLWNPAKLWHQWILNILLGIFILQGFSVLSEITNFPINILVSLFGIPLVLLILLKERK